MISVLFPVHSGEGKNHVHQRWRPEIVLGNKNPTKKKKKKKKGWRTHPKTLAAIRDLVQFFLRSQRVNWVWHQHVQCASEDEWIILKSLKMLFLGRRVAPTKSEENTANFVINHHQTSLLIQHNHKIFPPLKGKQVRQLRMKAHSP